jgi:hypothetical protein
MLITELSQRLKTYTIILEDGSFFNNTDNFDNSHVKGKRIFIYTNDNWDLPLQRIGVEESREVLNFIKRIFNKIKGRIRELKDFTSFIKLLRNKPDLWGSVSMLDRDFVTFELSRSELWDKHKQLQNDITDIQVTYNTTQLLKIFDDFLELLLLSDKLYMFLGNLKGIVFTNLLNNNKIAEEYTRRKQSDILFKTLNNKLNSVLSEEKQMRARYFLINPRFGSDIGLTESTDQLFNDLFTKTQKTVDTRRLQDELNKIEIGLDRNKLYVVENRKVLYA